MRKLIELKTKARILEAAITLFNEQGYANVRLQQIAGSLHMSVGNLAYHFNNKEALMRACHELVTIAFQEVLSLYQSRPGLEDLNQQLEAYFELATRYPFYFSDIEEVRHDHVRLHQQRKALLQRMIWQFEKRLSQLSADGLIEQRYEQEQFRLSAKALSNQIIFWEAQQRLLDEEHLGLSEFKDQAWSLITPYLSAVGRAAYYEQVKSL